MDTAPPQIPQPCLLQQPSLGKAGILSTDNSSWSFAPQPKRVCLTSNPTFLLQLTSAHFLLTG